MNCTCIIKRQDSLIKLDSEDNTHEHVYLVSLFQCSIHSSSDSEADDHVSSPVQSMYDKVVDVSGTKLSKQTNEEDKLPT